jgi:hypothetical protein
LGTRNTKIVRKTGLGFKSELRWLKQDLEYIIVLMESKDYERRPETITIPPAHVALRCDNRLQRDIHRMGTKKQEPDEKHVFFPLYLTWENQRTLYTFLLSEIILFLCFLDLFPLLRGREEKGPGKCGGAQIASHS